MIRRLLFLFFLLLTVSVSFAQNPSKGFKALEGKDYSAAKEVFESVLVLDENDVAANFGLSRYYGISASGEKDREKALEHLEKAEAGFGKLDEKTKGKMDKMGISSLALATRRERIEKSFLEVAKDENTVAAYEAFLERFPGSAAEVPAKNYRNKKAMDDALGDGSVAALDAFLEKYPEAHEAKEVTVTRNKMASEEALKTNTVAAFESFVTKYPDAPQTPQMQQRLYAAAFEEAKAENTAAAFESFIKKYPDSVFIPQAEQKLEWLKSQE